MKVLLISLEAPSGGPNGLRLPLGHLLRGLQDRADVTLVALRLADQPVDQPAGAVLIGRREPTGLARVVETAWSAAVREPAAARRVLGLLRPTVEELLASQHFDVIHVFGGPLAGLADTIAGRPAILTAMDAASHNIRARADVASGLRRSALLDEERRTIRHQRRHFGRFRRVVMVTPEDATTIRDLVPDASTAVIPNGVDVPADDGSRPETAEGPTVLFHGALSYAPNVLAVRHLLGEVWPLVRRTRPDARLVLVGRSPSAEVVRLAQAPGAHLVGEVPDVWPWLRSATVYACPMTSGTGIKNKLLEAMGAGLPCVVSPLATQGLDVTDGQELIIAPDAHQMAAAICDLLADPAGRATLGSAAASHVARAHSWSAFADAYLGLYADVSAGPSVRR